MMPLGAPSISKYGSLVWPDAQIVALRAHCPRTALQAPPMQVPKKSLEMGNFRTDDAYRGSRRGGGGLCLNATDCVGHPYDNK